MHQFVTAWIAALALLAAEPRNTWLIRGAQIVDGTGGPITSGDVRVEGDRIAEVGRLKPLEGELVVDGKGFALAPGFIDVHNHSERGIIRDPSAETQVSQGLTTLVLGPDGDSEWPIGEYLAARRA